MNLNVTLLLCIYLFFIVESLNLCCTSQAGFLFVCFLVYLKVGTVKRAEVCLLS